MSRPLARAVLVLCAVGGLAAPAVPAWAEPLPYGCEWGVGSSNGAQETTAEPVLALEDGLVVRVGDTVPLGPVRVEITVPAGAVAALRAAEVTETGPGTVSLGFLEEPGVEFTSRIPVGSTPVPADGPMVLTAAAVDAGSITAAGPGRHVLSSTGFSVRMPEHDTALFCEPPFESLHELARFRVVAADPTPSPPTTRTRPPDPAVRPSLVQTDVPDDAGVPVLPVALLGLGALAAAGLGRRGRPRTPRRH